MVVGKLSRVWGAIIGTIVAIEVALMTMLTKFAKATKAASDTIMAIGSALIIIAISAIIFGYTMGIGADLTSSISNETIKSQTMGFLTQLTTFGFSMYNFAILLVLAMVAAVLIAYFRRTGGSSGV